MKIWIDPGHGGVDGGACALGRREKDDNLVYALELDSQFREQGFDTAMTRTVDKAVSLTERTDKENREKCDLAIACHRNGANIKSATGLEIWLHSAAPARYVEWAREICEGIKDLGLPLRAGQKINGKVVPGVCRGFRSNPYSNYYANSGTNSPSMLIELGFVSNPEDNKFFDSYYKDACRVIVKASCSFLGVRYRETTEDAEHVAELKAELEQQREINRIMVADILALAEKYR